MRRARAGILVTVFLLPAYGSTATAGRWRDAFRHAITDPATWIPAAGAAAIVVSGTDEDLSRWAVEETPVFGSPERARNASDHLRTATHAGMLATGVLSRRGTRLSSRLEVATVHFAATVGSNNSASLLKRLTRRPRPDGSDDLSLPSNHATASFTYAAIGARNLEGMDLPGPLRRGLGLGLRTMAAASAWGRVEGGVHYPSDVLLGAALGNFGALLITEALLPSSGNVRLSLDLAPGGVQVGVSWRF